MAYVMALQQGWPTNDLQFQGKPYSTRPTVCPSYESFPVNDNIRGLIDAVNANTTSAFMWEWFTTKPFVNAGQVRFVLSFSSPATRVG
jgi:hypothetical protein